MNKIDRIKELVELLNHYRNEYYNNQTSEISDLEYDQLFDELSALEKETNFIMTVSPTQTVGYEVKSELKKVTHNHPMLSLDKTKDINDVVKFLGEQPGVVMAKMDGLTCSLRYVGGELVSAETRGDGEVGEDILHCAKTIKNLPLKIEYKGELVVDGEIIITYDDFEKINATLPEDQRYKHPRNLASGSIRQLDSSVAAQRNMKFIAWKLVKGWMIWRNSGIINQNCFTHGLFVLDYLGFEIVPRVNPTILNTPKEIEYLINFIKKECASAQYPIDGCVIGYDDVSYGESLGATGHHLRSQIAYKFYDELYETKLIDIEWTMGKTNTLTPTAIFETVNIDGTDVSKASLHNISIIKKLGLTNNCTVRVYKANQIIPQIDSCLRDGDSDIKIPKYCPVCGGLTEVVKENESEVLMCTNPNCSGKLLGRLKFFVSKPAVNIDGLSEATLDFLITERWVKKFKDIYHLEEHRYEWEQFDGFGEKSVDKILKSIEESRNITCANFITALSIDGVGKSVSKTISDAFNGDFYEFMEAFDDGFDWTTLTDIGDKTAQNINEYLAENDVEICELAEEFDFILPEKTEVKDNPFNGKSVAVTGKLIHFTRDSINAKLESLGAKPASGVTAKTHYLINNDPTSSSSKNKKANDLNIPIITEEEFLNMIGE